MRAKTLLALPVLLVAVSLFTASVMAQAPEIEVIATGRAIAIVDEIRTSGRAVLDVDLTPVMDVKFAFGEYEDVDAAEDWLYGWNITNVVQVGAVTVIIAIPADVGDGTIPGPVPIKIAIPGIDNIMEGRTVVSAMGFDFATGNDLKFTGKVLELDI